MLTRSSLTGPEFKNGQKRCRKVARAATVRVLKESSSENLSTGETENKDTIFGARELIFI